MEIIRISNSKLLIINSMPWTIDHAIFFCFSCFILFARDFCQSLKIKVQNELSFARITSLFVGIFGVLL
jgi:hypothetical protein